jgi:hypothetical protein
MVTGIGGVAGLIISGSARQAAWPAIKLLFRNRRLSDSKGTWGNMNKQQQSDGNALYYYITILIYGNIAVYATPAGKTALDLIKKADIAARFSSSVTEYPMNSRLGGVEFGREFPVLGRHP